MRYNNRIDLIRYSGSYDGLDDSQITSIQSNVPCLIIPITNVQELATFGLVSKMAYEVHIKNEIQLVDRVKIGGIEYTVNKTFLDRKQTILIVSGGA